MYKKCEEILHQLETQGKIKISSYEFPPKEELKLKLKDMLEDSVEEKYYLSDEQVQRIHKSTYNVSKTRIQQKDYRQTLCARDWKDPKCVRIGGIFDTEKSTHQLGSIYDKNGLAPTLDTMQGGWRQPCIEEHKHLHKVLKETLENNIDKLQNGSYIDSYNRSVRTDDLSGTITTRVDASNNVYVATKEDKWSDLD